MNANKYSCDGPVVIIDRDPVRITPSITKGVQELSLRLRTLIVIVRSKRSDVTTGLSIKLWDRIVSSIINFQTIYPLQPRIWWCPTAEFPLLPILAANYLDRDKRTVQSIEISDGTETAPCCWSSKRKWLHSIETELANVGQCIDGLAKLTRIEGKISCVSKVFLRKLSKNRWVHLACRGIPNTTRPFESAFALHEGHLTIQRIIQCNLKNSEFAYLSACHTTVGDEESPDEVIHLAAAMQFAGFRSVIGTMWSVDGAETNKITSVFCKHMTDESGRLDHMRAV